MILALLALGAWWTMACCPATPIGRMLHRLLVDRPAAWLGRVKRGQLILAFLLVASVAGLIWLIGEEGTRLIGMATPELVSWAVAVDLSSAVDIAVTVILAGSALRVRQALKVLLPRRGARQRRSRPAARRPDPERRHFRPIPRRTRHMRSPPGRHLVGARAATRRR